MIEATEVHKYYGRFEAVRSLSFRISTGEVVGLLGPNGAGKTTSIRMITGYLPPSSGRIAVCGKDTISHTLAARQNIGYLPESNPLYPEMRVRDYLTFRARLHGVRASKRQSAIAKTLDRCWLSDVSRKRIGYLSKGYRQRVGLAAALIHNPPVLVLDEPSSGLDPTQILETRRLIRELAKDRTVLVSSHVLPEVERTCDRVIIMARGRVRADGHPARLLARLERDHPPLHVVEVLVDSRSGHGQSGSWAGDVPRILSQIRAVPGAKAVAHEWVSAARPTPDPTQHSPSGSTPDLASRAGGPGSDWVRLLVTPEAGHPDLREQIARTLNKGLVLYRDLERRLPTLEHLFSSIIEADSTNPTATEHRESSQEAA
ncbi:MAG: ATP-binding cassette domain-containing protein [Phycisphaeraceae bacterium]|nr:ATP-binding cassette domain-containing protein [Phycisphaeraceae bacterium]